MINTLYILILTIELLIISIIYNVIRDACIINLS